VLAAKGQTPLVKKSKERIWEEDRTNCAMHPQPFNERARETVCFEVGPEKQREQANRFHSGTKLFLPRNSLANCLK